VYASHVANKELMMKYIEIFMKELKEGTIRERISKADKIQILKESNKKY